MKLLMTVLFTMIFMACTKTQVCDSAKTVAGVVASQAAVQLDCKNVDVIRADIDKKLVDLKICELTATPPVAGTISVKSAIGDVVCKPLVEGLVGGALTQVPATWGCAGGPVTDVVKTKLIEACQKAL